jgi:hypothetical protein
MVRRVHELFLFQTKLRYYSKKKWIDLRNAVLMCDINQLLYECMFKSLVKFYRKVDKRYYHKIDDGQQKLDNSENH